MAEDEKLIDDTTDAPGETDAAVMDVQTDDNMDAAEPSAAEEPVSGEAAATKRKKYHAPLYIAACIFLAAILFFCVKQCFFNTDINGTWGFTVKRLSNNEDMTFNLSFEDSTARLQSCGTVYIGRLSIADENGAMLTDDEGNPLMSLNLNLGGKPFVYKFNYEFTGNVFTGRSLRLTDVSGLFYEADTKDSDPELVKKRKQNTEFVQKGDKTYYIWTLTPSAEDYNVKKPDSFKPDKQLTGSWLYKSEMTAFPYTISFNEDGTFEQHSYELEIYGTYSVKNGICTMNYMELGNTEREVQINYKLSGNKLTLSQEYEGTVINTSELTRTDDKYAFRDSADNDDSSEE